MRLTCVSEKLKLAITPESATATIQLLDAKKHVLSSRPVDLQNEFRQHFNLTALESGTYQLSVRTTDGLAVVKTVVIHGLPAHKPITLNA